MDFSVFFHVPFSVGSMSPKQTLVGIGLIVALTVRAFERMGAWFAFLGFQSRWVDFGIDLAAPTEFSVMFGFVGTITFDAFGLLNSA